MKNKYHYVYRITNTILNKHYYGVRSSNTEPKLDLGVKYFSSSSNKDFIKEQKENKSIFKYKVIRLFKSRKEANNAEIYLHNKFNVAVNDLFYNVAKATSTGFSREGVKCSATTKQKMSDSASNKSKKKLHKDNIAKCRVGKNHSLETIEKIKIGNTGKIVSLDTRLNLSKSLTGKPKSEETKQKMRNAKLGKSHSEETKQKMKESAKNRKT